MKKTIIILAACGAMLLAIGANPRYLEELRTGGGYGSMPDGGADFEKDGDIFTDGAITTNATLTAKVGVTAGAYDAFDHSASVLSDTNNNTYLNLNEGDAVNGGTLWYDGVNAKLGLGTRNDNSSVTTALEIAKGSANVAVKGSLDAQGDIVIKTWEKRIKTQNGHLQLEAHRAAGDSCQVNISPVPAANDSAVVRFFPATTGTGSRKFQVMKSSTWNDYAVEIDALTGNTISKGDVTVEGGDLVAGTVGGTRGVLAAWHGSGGAAPACVKLASPNGTVWYLFVRDDGTVKVHNALPTSNANGTVVGLQF